MNDRLRHTTLLAALLFVFSGSLNTVAVAENQFLDDLFLGVWSPFTSKWETSISLCVSTETNESLYKVTTTGLQPGDTYYVTNDVGDRVNYNVFWHFGRNLNRQVKLKSGIPSRRNFPYATDERCSDGPNAKVRVRLNRNEIRRAPTGIYTDTLLLMLSPV